LAAADEAALTGLVGRGILTVEQADAVRTALSESRGGTRPQRWLAEAAGYVGGALAFGGAGLLLAISWDRLTEAARAALLAGVTAVLLVAGLAVAGGPAALGRLRRGANPTRLRVAGLLFALAAVTAATVTGVLVDDRASIPAGATGLAVAVAGYALLPGPFGLLASVGFSVFLTVVVGDDQWNGDQLRMGVVLLLVGVVWAALAALGVARPRALGLGLGAAIALLGAQEPLLGAAEDAVWAYSLTLAVGAACFLLYPGQRAAVLLVAGVVAIALAVPEMVWDVTDGAVGGAVALVVAGVALIAGSALGLRLWRTTATPDANGRPGG
jgi:hypothetical protein